MCFLEDEFFSLLEAGSSGRPHEASPKESSSCEASPAYPKETVEKLRDIAAAMISAGYGTECCEVFSAARSKEVEAAVSSIGYEKGSIDDVVKMPWESLEGAIATWIKSFRHFVSVILPAEHDLCNQVFSVDPDISTTLFQTVAGGVLLHLLVLPEAVAMTKRSAEKLFKVLDIYDALRDATPTIDSLLPDQADDSSLADELTSVRSRLGDAAISIFCDLEGSVKSDAAKTPVPGGAVHPLTRYVMNYIKYACEYKNTLDLVFHDHHTPFSAQLMELMDLLDSNLEAKSKLYKDPALSNIFLMNNGRYIAQKIKGSSEINMLLGETWYRKRSSNLRQYHKNYQRETWAKVLACFKDEGLTAAKGGVQKPVVKERLKSFNSLFEEIHRTQSAWVVSDEQLQSELRVSVSAVVVPAYRSFLGRFAQCLTPGRQTEKYVKFGAEDLESYIDELFDGKVPAPVARRRT
ncbi:exocyst complex component EXO70C2-like [Typha latifolia]|uniref:exocyst complex component EXO70C2-like n=1 Tax=Typha latifolia TaxID=4733 RepID=UPI003C2DB3EB